MYVWSNMQLLNVYVWSNLQLLNMYVWSNLQLLFIIYVLESQQQCDITWSVQLVYREEVIYCARIFIVTKCCADNECVRQYIQIVR